MSIEMQIAALQKAAAEQTEASVSLAQHVSEHLSEFAQGVEDVFAVKQTTAEQAVTMTKQLAEVEQFYQQANYAQLKTALDVVSCADTREYVDEQKITLQDLANTTQQQAINVAMGVEHNHAQATICAAIGELVELNAKEVTADKNLITILQADMASRSTALTQLSDQLYTLKEHVFTKVEHIDSAAEQVHLDKQHARANASLTALAVDLMNQQQNKLYTAFSAVLNGTLTSSQITELFNE